MVHVVTGAAGFIGSHLVDALLAAGHEVLGIDRFSDYYDPAIKRANLTTASADPRFRLVEADLRVDDVVPTFTEMAPVEVVYHLAAQAGVHGSWADGFADYDADNIVATQRLLEACRRTSVPRLVYASSSSVYGQADRYPVVETDLPAPFSPYGVTKLAGEHLTRAYAANHGLSTVALRYFTVYGPRQRPDMAFHRMIRAALDGTPFPRFGDGRQIRDFTYVGDVVRATMLAGASDATGVVNVCTGGQTVLADVIAAVGDAVGRPVPIDERPVAAGDVGRTGGSNARAAEVLGWTPQVALTDGIAAEVAWLRPDR